MRAKSVLEAGRLKNRQNGKRKSWYPDTGTPENQISGFRPGKHPFSCISK